jgi:predicted RNA-binding Zn-ribbon protein involved in translation (DUF1610 family)
MSTHLTVVGESCLVCGSEAGRGQGARDAVQIRCPRCGPFIITRTALAMMASRLETDERLRARVSHAIRSATSDEHWLEIDSTSVDKLVDSQLPPVERQIDNFLKWMSYKLGDDGMGTVELPDNIDQLAGVVGAVDGARIEALISAMHKKDLIERLSDNRVRLTTSAWDRLDQLTGRSSTSEPTALVFHGEGAGGPEELALPLPEMIKAHCPNCGAHKNAEVMTRHIESQEEDEWSEDITIDDYTVDDYRILKCRGCDAVYVQRVHLPYGLPEPDRMADVVDPTTGEYNPDYSTTTYWPAPSRRKPPVWLVKIQDQVLRSLLGEVYQALDADIRSLAAMGIRAALDRTFELAGLRKAGSARLAELGASDREIMAITGHQTAKEVDRYTRGARQRQLAASAMAKWEQGRNE